MNKKFLFSFLAIILVTPFIASAAGFSEHWFKWLKKDQSAQVVKFSTVIKEGEVYKKGDKSEIILEIQKILADKGLYKGDISGVFGPRTQSAILDWQKSHGLTATGVLDIETVNSIRGGGGISANVSYPSRICNENTDPWIKVLSPNGGETYQSGQQITVTWQSCKIPLDQLLEINVNGSGVAMGFLAGDGALNDGSEVISQDWPTGTYRITIGTPLYPGEFYNSALAIYDRSDNVFNIVDGVNNQVTSACNAKVLYPHPGQTYTLAENATPSGNSIRVYGFVLVTSDPANCVWSAAGSLIPTSSNPPSGSGGLMTVVESGGQSYSPLFITGNYNFANPTIGHRLYSQSIDFNPQIQPSGQYTIQFTDMDNQNPIYIPINIEY